MHHARIHDGRTYSVCLLMLILKSFNIVQVISIQTEASCFCIRVKECKPFTDLLLNHAPHERQALFQRIRNAGCGFERGSGEQPLACCPSLRDSSTVPTVERNFKDDEAIRFVRRMSRTANAEDHRQLEPWIWGRTSLQSTESVDRVTDRFNEFTEDKNNFRNGFKLFPNIEGLIENTKSNRNCPHGLGEERGIEDDENYVHRNDHDDFAHNDHHDCNGNSFSHLPNLFGPQLSDFEDESIENEEQKYPTYKIIFPSTPRRKTNPVPQQPVIGSKTNGLAPARRLAPFTNSPDCGSSVVNRVLGGMDATPGLFPWIARIGYLNITSTEISYRCSGSAVSDLYIVTAAHCVQDLGLELRLLHILIGGAQELSTSRIFNISNIISHPNYNQPRFANDIALVRIVRAQIMEDSFSVICLPLNNSESFTNRLIGGTGIVAGWSSTTDGSAVANDNVQFLRLPIVNTTECAIGYATRSEQFEVPIVITPSQICAQGQPMQDSCQGDSGGPFMDDGTSGLINTDGRYTLLGIVAFGWPGCSNQSNILPGVYTRVSSFVDWIAESII